MTDINDTVYNIWATKKAYGLQSYFLSIIITTIILI